MTHRLALTVAAVAAAATTLHAQQVDIALIVYDAPSGQDIVSGVDLRVSPETLGTTIDLPTQLTVGQSIFLEAWVKTSTLNGLSTAGIDIGYDPDVLAVPAPENDHVDLAGFWDDFGARCPVFAPPLKACSPTIWFEGNTNFCDVDLDCRTCVGGSSDGAFCSAAGKDPNAGCPGGVCAIRNPPEQCLADPTDCVPVPGLVDDIGGSNFTGGEPKQGEWARIATVEFEVLAIPDPCTIVTAHEPDRLGGPTGGAVTPVLFGIGAPDTVTITDWVIGTGGDADCDGFDDAGDNCPDVVNRLQDDVDGDGFGDLCDPCPADPTNAPETCIPAGSGAVEVQPGIGARLIVTDTSLELNVPPAALVSDTTVSATQTVPADPLVPVTIGSVDGEGVMLANYDMRPDGLEFTVSTVKLRIVADVTDLSDEAQRALRIFTRSAPGEPYEVAPSRCTRQEVDQRVIATCTADVAHLSEYALIDASAVVIVPAVSTWGLAILAIATTIAATIITRRQTQTTR